MIDALGEIGILYDESPHLRDNGMWQQRYMLDLGLIDEGAVTDALVQPLSVQPAPTPLSSLAPEFTELAEMAYAAGGTRQAQVNLVRDGATRNLVVNAIQHSPDGAAIELDARADGDRVLLTVTDHAGGIAADDLDRVFEAGWRGSGPRTPAPLPQLTAGAGIGLAIARGVVDAHDGDIAAQNTADGCRFTVTLPAA